MMCVYWITSVPLACITRSHAPFGETRHSPASRWHVQRRDASKGNDAVDPTGGRSQVVPGIRQVEALVGQGEVGNDGVGKGDRQRRPIVERRVDDLDPPEEAFSIDLGAVDDGPPPPFDDARSPAGTRGPHPWPVFTTPRRGRAGPPRPAYSASSASDASTSSTRTRNRASTSPVSWRAGRNAAGGSTNGSSIRASVGSPDARATTPSTPIASACARGSTAAPVKRSMTMVFDRARSTMAWSRSLISTSSSGRGRRLTRTPLGGPVDELKPARKAKVVHCGLEGPRIAARRPGRLGVPTALRPRMRERCAVTLMFFHFQKPTPLGSEPPKCACVAAWLTGNWRNYSI